MHTTKLFFLGPVQYFLGDAPVKLKSVKATALLAYLAVNSTPQSRDHLTDLLADRHDIHHATLQVEPDTHSGCDQVDW